MDIKNLKVNKTSVDLVITKDKGKLVDGHNQIEELMAVAVLAGASPNCLKQISNFEFTDDKVKAINEAKREFQFLLGKFQNILKVPVNTIKCETHTFS